MDITQQREVDEAIEAGKRALRSLNEADNYLGSAKNWGIVDILGGGGLSSYIKHQKLSSAQAAVNRATQDLRVFAKELSDVVSVHPLTVKFDTLTQMIDIFCDDFLVDVLVQSKINKAKKNIEETKREVQNTLNKLINLR